MDFDMAIKRASLLSDRVYGLHSLAEPKRKISQLVAPPDKFFLATIFSFFTGMAGVIPMTFFLTANDYWMYKLRDIQYDTYDLNNKTFLQKMFASMSSIGNAVPSLISVFLTMKYGHKIEMRKRFLITVGIISSMFIIFTALVKVDTDSWQTLFFIIALVVLGTIALVQPLYSMTNSALLSRFPGHFMKLNMFGVACGGVFGSSLQIISLTIGKSSTQVAMIYFSCGTIIMCITLLLTYLMKYSPVINFYVNAADDRPKLTYTVKDYIEVTKDVWPLVVMMFLYIIPMGVSHPSITSLIVSEGYNADEDNLWYNKYFVVVVTFFMFDFFQLVGRFFAKPFVNRNNYWWFIGICAVRAFIMSPLFLFCNAQPRSHLPVWFPHDYQYIIIHITASLSMSIILTAQFLSVPNFAGEKSELAYMVMTGLMLFTITIISPLNPVIVTLL